MIDLKLSPLEGAILTTLKCRANGVISRSAILKRVAHLGATDMTVGEALTNLHQQGAVKFDVVSDGGITHSIVKITRIGLQINLSQ